MASNINCSVVHDSPKDVYCEPCKTDGIRKYAKYYCEQCQEYLCSDCKDFHKKFKMSQSHKLLSGSTMIKLSQLLQRKDCYSICGCSQNRQVQHFCQDHEDAVCDQCCKNDHHKCIIYSIEDKLSDYQKSSLESVFKRMETFKTDAKQHLRNRQEDCSTLEELTNTCRSNIKAFRAELNELLDTLEDNMLKDTDKCKLEQMICIENDISTLTVILQLVDSDNKVLEETQKTEETESMYVASVRISKNIREYSALLATIKEESETPKLSFEKNRRLLEIEENAWTLGKVQMQTRIWNRKSKTNLINAEVCSIDTADIKHSVDESEPWITGCAFVSAEDMVVCDHTNDCLKLIDSAMVVKGILKLPSYPYDIAVVDDRRAIVTYPGPEQLQYVYLYPKMKRSNIIEVDKGCYGVDVFREEIYVSCHDQPGNGEVQIMDLDGVLKRKIGNNPDGSYLFKSPYYVTVVHSDMILISDQETSIITCTTGDGDMLQQFEHEELKGPLGMLTDGENNIIVCCKRLGEIKIITSDGRKCRNLLTSKDVLKHPQSIAYRENDGIVVVGCGTSSKLLYLKLK